MISRKIEESLYKVSPAKRMIKSVWSDHGNNIEMNFSEWTVILCIIKQNNNNRKHILWFAIF